MVSFVNCALQRHTGAFERAHMIADIHQQCGIVWKDAQHNSKFTLKLIARPHVDSGFFEADSRRAPYRDIAGDHEHACSQR